MGTILSSFKERNFLYKILKNQINDFLLLLPTFMYFSKTRNILVLRQWLITHIKGASKTYSPRNQGVP